MIKAIVTAGLMCVPEIFPVPTMMAYKAAEVANASPLSMHIQKIRRYVCHNSVIQFLQLMLTIFFRQKYCD